MSIFILLTFYCIDYQIHNASNYDISASLNGVYWGIPDRTARRKMKELGLTRLRPNVFFKNNTTNDFIKVLKNMYSNKNSNRFSKSWDYKNKKYELFGSSKEHSISLFLFVYQDNLLIEIITFDSTGNEIINVYKEIFSVLNFNHQSFKELKDIATLPSQSYSPPVVAKCEHDLIPTDALPVAKCEHDLIPTDALPVAKCEHGILPSDRLSSRDPENAVVSNIVLPIAKCEHGISPTEPLSKETVNIPLENRNFNESNSSTTASSPAKQSTAKSTTQSNLEASNSSAQENRSITFNTVVFILFAIMIFIIIKMRSTNKNINEHWKGFSQKLNHDVALKISEYTDHIEKQNEIINYQSQKIDNLDKINLDLDNQIRATQKKYNHINPSIILHNSLKKGVSSAKNDTNLKGEKNYKSYISKTFHPDKDPKSHFYDFFNKLIGIIHNQEI